MEFETIGGLVLHELGELPEEGTGITIDNLEFTVVSVENNRIKTLAVRGHETKAQTNPDTEEEEEETQVSQVTAPANTGPGESEQRPDEGPTDRSKGT